MLKSNPVSLRVIKDKKAKISRFRFNIKMRIEHVLELKLKKYTFQTVRNSVKFDPVIWVLITDHSQSLRQKCTDQSALHFL